MIIKIGVPGRIVDGQDAGSFVYIQDDIENTGGYLILQSGRVEDVQRGYDNWVEGWGGLEQWFRNCRWRIDWLG
jgi:hypothetical protein